MYVSSATWQATTSERNGIPRSALYTALHTSEQHVHQESRGEKAYGRSSVRLYMASETDATP